MTPGRRGRARSRARGLRPRRRGGRSRRSCRGRDAPQYGRPRRCRWPTGFRDRRVPGSLCCSHPCGARTQWGGSAGGRRRRSPSRRWCRAGWSRRRGFRIAADRATRNGGTVRTMPHNPPGRVRRRSGTCRRRHARRRDRASRRVHATSSSSSLRTPASNVERSRSAKSWRVLASSVLARFANASARSAPSSRSSSTSMPASYLAMMPRLHVATGSRQATTRNRTSPARSAVNSPRQWSLPSACIHVDCQRCLPRRRWSSRTAISSCP